MSDVEFNPRTEPESAAGSQNWPNRCSFKLASTQISAPSPCNAAADDPNWGNFFDSRPPLAQEVLASSLALWCLAE